MTWMNDANCMAHLDKLLISQQSELNLFLEAIYDHMDETPIWGILVLYGKFVMHYNELRNDATENEALLEAIARLGNDELTQALVATIIGTMVDRRVQG